MEKEDKDLSFINSLIDKFDDKIEDNPELTSSETMVLSKTIPNKKALEDGLPAILDKANTYKEKIEGCDKQIKNWQASKKMWQARAKSFMETMSQVLANLKIPGNTIKAEGIKLATSSRTSLEVDEDWLVGKYQMFADALQTQLPDYVKVSLTIDKNKLFAHVKQDDTMLVNNPDKIHTKVTTSTSIK